MYGFSSESIRLIHFNLFHYWKEKLTMRINRRSLIAGSIAGAAAVAMKRSRR